MDSDDLIRDLMDLYTYTSNHIDSFLLNYEVFAKDLAELASDWRLLDAEERSDQQAVFIQAWGNRHVVGQLFQAKRLTRQQEERLAQADQLLLEQASFMERGFGVDFAHVLNLFRWGTPLAQTSQLVRIETDTTSLNLLAQTTAEPNR
jgi:hypothetical protein